MKFNQHIRLTPPQMLKFLKLAGTSNILWNRPPGHLELPHRRHYNREWLDKHFGKTFRANISGKHFGQTFRANISGHVRFSTPTLPCAFLNANFAMCVSQRKILLRADIHPPSREPSRYRHPGEPEGPTIGPASTVNASPHRWLCETFKTKVTFSHSLQLAKR